jgi:hypothetical protein
MAAYTKVFACKIQLPLLMFGSPFLRSGLLLFTELKVQYSTAELFHLGMEAGFEPATKSLFKTTWSYTSHHILSIRHLREKAHYVVIKLTFKRTVFCN